MAGNPIRGGAFMRYHPGSGTFEHLASIPLENEGLITLEMDKAGNRLIALTWPSGILFTYDIPNDRLLQFGATNEGRIWEFDPARQRPVEVIKGLSLDSVPPVAEASFEITEDPHFFWRN